jgi:phosphatidylserine/phosphatidylglycerophosphate/cardiolipin synthase-like enzyme
MLFRAKIPPADLLTSELFDERTFYSAFIKDLKQCQREVIIESPYMTTARLAILLPVLRKLVKRGVKVRINTRYPGHHDELLRIQAWMATKDLKKAGIKVKFFNDYNHRKIAVLDDRILWEGSLNILSQNHSREVMRRIESEQLANQMVCFLKLNKFYW